MPGYKMVTLDTLDEVDDGRSPYRPVRHHLGISAFGANVWGPRRVGERLINDHDETGPYAQEELYVVLEGRARFEVDCGAFDAPAASMVFVRPGVRRSAVAEEDGTTLLVVGAPRGAMYRPWGLELWAPFQPLYQAREYAAIADRAADVLAGDPPYWALYYNFACAASFADRPDEALTYLRRALELNDDLRASAREDSDLDALRQDPRFQALLPT